MARCAVCRHPESDHGRTGSRPCLAMVGRLHHRDFCACDRFEPQIRAAVPEVEHKDTAHAAQKSAA